MTYLYSRQHNKNRNSSSIFTFIYLNSPITFFSLNKNSWPKQAIIATPTPSKLLFLSYHKITPRPVKKSIRTSPRKSRTTFRLPSPGYIIPLLAEIIEGPSVTNFPPTAAARKRWIMDTPRLMLFANLRVADTRNIVAASGKFHADKLVLTRV